MSVSKGVCMYNREKKKRLAKAGVLGREGDIWDLHQGLSLSTAISFSAA